MGILMSSLPRRKLSELEFIYKQNQNLRDVYVEGEFDCNLIKWFFRECGIEHVNVYPISSIEIPDGDIVRVGLDANNRERVVYLSGFLREKNVEKAACVIDADFSRILPSGKSVPPLFETDYSCIEMYFFNNSNLSKFLTLSCQKSGWPTELVLDALRLVLENFFLYRAANRELKWRMDWLDKIGDVKIIKGWSLDLKHDSFITRLLNKNCRLKERNKFEKYVENIRNCLTSDPRNQMNGHDFLALLTWYIREKKVKCFTVCEETVRACMMATLDHNILRKEPLFINLIAYIS